MKLTAITAEVHIWNGVPNTAQPVRLGVEIDGLRFLRIAERRGESIQIDAEPLAEDDFGEGGRIEVRDLTEMVGIKRGAEIGVPRYVEQNGDVVGVAFQGILGADLCLWCEDDEFRWGSESDMRNALRSLGPLRIEAPIPVGLAPVRNRG